MPVVALVAAGSSLMGASALAGTMVAGFTAGSGVSLLAGLAAGAELVGAVATVAGAVKGGDEGAKWMQTGGYMMLGGKAVSSFAGEAAKSGGGVGASADTVSQASKDGANAALQQSTGMQTPDMAGSALNAPDANANPLLASKSVSIGASPTQATPQFAMSQPTGAGAYQDAIARTASSTPQPAQLSTFEKMMLDNQAKATEATNNATQVQKYGMLANAGGSILQGMSAEEQAKWMNDQQVQAAALRRQQELQDYALRNTSRAATYTPLRG